MNLIWGDLLDKIVKQISIEGDLRAQIADYIPEIDGVGYELSVEFFDDLTRHIEYMVISFTIQG
jgi:hypothetical protein